MKDDLISRQAALDALGERPVVWTDKIYYILGARNQYDMDRLAIETVPSAQQWVSCKKRLPNRDEYIKNNGLFIVSDGNRSYSEWYDIYDKRRFGEPTMSGFRVDYAVTHWMPLPEPWKGERDG